MTCNRHTDARGANSPLISFNADDLSVGNIEPYHLTTFNDVHSQGTSRARIPPSNRIVAHCASAALKKPPTHWKSSIIKVQEWRHFSNLIGIQ